MASSRVRDLGGGQRRAKTRFTTSAWSLILLTAVMLAGCDLATPTEPNTPGQLTGQTTNQQFTFTGTITLSAPAGSLKADDTSTLVITATVRDAAGNPIPNLTNIQFTTDLGTFVAADGTTSTAVSATTFNGIAQALFQSSGRVTGTATIQVSIGQVASTFNVALQAAPIQGTISAAFDSATGSTTKKGVAASASVPVEIDIFGSAEDTAGTAIVGASVHFRIEEDTTSDTTINDPVVFVGKKTTTTNSGGVASTVIRVSGPGDVVIFADLIDPLTGAIVATSNQIVLVTTGAATAPTLTLTFSDGSETQHSFGAAAPFSEGIIATATGADGTSKLAGATVKFVIDDDSTGGATFANGSTTATTTTDGAGQAITAITVTSPGQVVTIHAEVYAADGVTLIARSNNIVALYD